MEFSSFLQDSFVYSNAQSQSRLTTKSIHSCRKMSGIAFMEKAEYDVSLLPRTHYIQGLSILDIEQPEKPETVTTGYYIGVVNSVENHRLQIFAWQYISYSRKGSFNCYVPGYRALRKRTRIYRQIAPATAKAMSRSQGTGFPSPELQRGSRNAVVKKKTTPVLSSIFISQSSSERITRRHFLTELMR